MADEGQAEARIEASEQAKPGETDFPPPPPPPAGYLRVAVVQLGFHPSAVVEQVHLLEQPAINASVANWFGTALSNNLRNLRACEKRIGKKVRSIYVEHEMTRLAEIIRACSAWGVHVLVFPEYSVPPECLEHLLPATRAMTVVLGTHSVEPHLVDHGYYDQFGISVPQCGTSVSPVAIDGALKHFQAKLNSTHLEVGMIDGRTWDPITLPSSQQMGILICLDFIKREAQQYRTHVASKIDNCKILAVPSLTPDYTTERFDARAFDESHGYGRSALYADIASGGGSSIFVASALARPRGTFPFGIPRLAVGEEGVVVADLDVEYTRTAEKVARTYSDRKAAVPVAASVFRYRTVQTDADHMATLNTLFRTVDRTCRASIARTLEQNADSITKLADTSSPTAASNLNSVLESADQARNAEELLCRLRHIAFSEEVYPLAALDELRARAALDEAEAYTPNRFEGEETARLRRRLRELCGETA